MVTVVHTVQYSHWFWISLLVIRVVKKIHRFLHIYTANIKFTWDLLYKIVFKNYIYNIAWRIEKPLKLSKSWGRKKKLITDDSISPFYVRSFHNYLQYYVILPKPEASIIVWLQLFIVEPNYLMMIGPSSRCACRRTQFFKKIFCFDFGLN